jgi:site-specific DNA-methyltransferase (adenine-specific)
MPINLILGDCIEKMKEFPSHSIDLVLTDPPYGTTQCKWDSVIPFDLMWEQLLRIIKDNGAICLFGSEPFSSRLRISNIEMFKYDWIYQKNKTTGFLNAKRQPLNDNELISVFYKKQCIYNPQKTKAEKVYKRGHVKKTKCDCYGVERNYFQIDDGLRYPTRIIYFDNNKTSQQFHPTQKPIDLLEYLIKTYTNQNDTVLDFTMGSGSTGIACQNLNRGFIGVEKDKEYFDIAQKRIKDNSVQLQIDLE